MLGGRQSTNRGVAGDGERHAARPVVASAAQRAPVHLLTAGAGRGGLPVPPEQG
jgi:hypothetical protein